MSPANMWSEDEDGSSSSSLRAGVAGGSSSGSEDRWPFPPAAEEDTDVTDMEAEEVFVNELQGLATPTPTQGYFVHGYMSDDEDDEDEDEDDDMIGGGGAHVDILAVASVLTQGIDLQDDFGSAGTMMPNQTQGSSHQPHAMPGHSLGGISSSNLGPEIGGAHQSIFHNQHSGLPTMPAAHVGGTQQGNLDAPQGGQQANILNNHHPQVNHTQLLHNNPISVPHAAALGPENYSLSDFIMVWAWQNAAHQGSARERGRYPWLNKINPQMARNVSHVDYMDLEGDRYDVQGIDWEDLGVTRSEARERRLNTYKNYVNITASDRWEVSTTVL